MESTILTTASRLSARPCCISQAVAHCTTRESGNVIDYYRSLLSEEDIHDISATMFGRQSQLLVSIGLGFYGVAGRLVEPLMTPKDREENFVLLWAV